MSLIDATCWRTVTLRSGAGTITVSVHGNFFLASTDERDFILGMIRQIDAYELSPDGAEPTTREAPAAATTDAEPGAATAVTIAADDASAEGKPTRASAGGPEQPAGSEVPDAAAAPVGASPGPPPGRSPRKLTGERPSRAGNRPYGETSTAILDAVNGLAAWASCADIAAIADIDDRRLVSERLGYLHDKNAIARRPAPPDDRALWHYGPLSLLGPRTPGRTP